MNTYATHNHNQSNSVTVK